ncbi:MAG TPA: hypothetical protein HA224_03845 [Nanoarchaeota archaeon]|nr:hypothetical protein [Nanoarchaeota archaeon]
MDLSDYELEFATRVLCDVPIPRKLDLAYLFAQTADNASSVFATGAQLRRANPSLEIAICGSDNTHHGYPGLHDWHARLLLEPYSVPLQKIVSIPHLPAPNTLAEAENLVRYAKKHCVTSVAIVAPPFHQPRACLTTITIAKEEYPELQVYNAVGVTLPWGEVALHSQGILSGKRSELIREEWDRIRKYQHSGDRCLCSIKVALDYLNARDTR